MANLYASASYVNATDGHRIGDDPIEETFTDNVGELFRNCRSEFGRCTGKVYIDRRVATNDDGGERWEVVHVGWVFVKRDAYQDQPHKTYLREVWVTVYAGPEIVTRERTYFAIGGAS
jgi:hypothetical protein